MTTSVITVLASKTDTFLRPNRAGRRSEGAHKASLGTSRTTRLWRRSRVRSCSGGPFTTRWHSEELRRWDCRCVWREEAFNQVRQTWLKAEKNGGLGHRWGEAIVCVWLMTHICVFWRGNYPLLVCGTMCAPSTGAMETEGLRRQRDDLMSGFPRARDDLLFHRRGRLDLDVPSVTPQASDVTLLLAVVQIWNARR